jgi:uncharacterized protein with FMN-binding domain
MVVIPRRAATVFVGTVVVVLLLFGFKTPDQPIGATTGGAAGIVADGGTASGTSGNSGSSGSSGAGSSGSSGAGSVTAPTATPVPSAAAGAATVTGPTVSTRYGPVQVRIAVSGGQVTEISALQLPSGGRSGRISQVAEPILHDEALAAQSAQIDTVSGATYTSAAYEQSLQAALDQAGI